MAKVLSSAHAAMVQAKHIAHIAMAPKWYKHQMVNVYNAPYVMEQGEQDAPNVDNLVL